MRRNHVAVRGTYGRSREKRGPYTAPPPAAIIEARNAQLAAAERPLDFVFGDPLPGRSVLDKMKKKGLL